jgi:hypothetical protein
MSTQKRRRTIGTGPTLGLRATDHATLNPPSHTKPTVPIRARSAETRIRSFVLPHHANGNRQTESGAAASTYSISPSGNLVSSISGALART